MVRNVEDSQYDFASVFQDSDLLPGGYIRITTVAKRLNIRYGTVLQWNERGIGVGRGKSERRFYLSVDRLGGEARTKAEWLRKFFVEAESYRQALREKKRKKRRAG